LTEAPQNRQRMFVVLGVACLLGTLFLQLMLSVRQNSITWDEDNHIFAGYMSWKHADFGLNPEHPPLVKLLATLPLLNLPLRVPAQQGRDFKIEAFLDGKDFLFKNNADMILFRTRMTASLFTLALALLVFLAAREMFGTAAGFIALSLLAFDPNLLAHGAYVTTDVGLTCGMFATIYVFYRYVKAPSTWRLVITGLAAGVALAAKHTGILVFPMLVLLAICEVALGRRENKPGTGTGKRMAQLAAALALIALIAVTVLWATYGFRYQARPDGLRLNPPLAESLQHLSRPRDAQILSLAARWHALPESYLYGLADVRIMADFYTSYLFGTIYPHGIWYYFPAAFAIKSTLSFMALLLLAIVAIATGRLTGWREILFLTVPSALHLAVAMGSGLNIGVRHILPLYAFLSVLGAGAALTFIRRDWRWGYAVVALLLFQAVSSGRTFPSYIAYSNELWGGPSQTYKYLSDSNADWGQQLKATKKYLDQRGVKECWFVYFAEGVVDTGYYGIPCKPLPTQDTQWVNEQMETPASIDGPVLVSAGHLSGFEFGPGALNPYEQFKTLRPTAVIQYAVFVFDGHFDIPLASAISHTQKAGNLLNDGRATEALTEAQQAVSLAPNAVRPNVMLGDVLHKLNRPDEARQAYEKALMLARTIEPEFQGGWISGLEEKLSKK
jgi:4-amino-4-deoxy-L-arabinose transferase-like glycosyltransferase